MPVKMVAKALEHRFKWLLGKIFLLLPERSGTYGGLSADGRVLVFRLDQKIGNGLMLLPLLHAVRSGPGQFKVDLLIHAPVAELFQKAENVPADRIYAYNQPVLFRKPWRLFKLIGKLRRNNYDFVLCCNNPNSFSLSQAILGRIVGPGCLVGFRSKVGARFFDHMVVSGTDRHYAMAMIDLWKHVHPHSLARFFKLQLPEQCADSALKKIPEYAQGGILLWLGATGRKALPAPAWEKILQLLEHMTDLPLHFAAGPSDRQLLGGYPAWIRQKVVVWQWPLTETAGLIARFSAFFTADTGPMHLAAAVACPVFSIFMHTSLHQYGYSDFHHSTALKWEDCKRDVHYLENAIRSFLLTNNLRIREPAAHLQIGKA